MTDFGRVLTAMVTPFDSNMQVDYNKARELAAYLVDHGSDGIVVAGTTGESPTLTNDERNRLFQVVVDEVGQRAKVIAGTGNNDTFDSVHMTKDAEKAGVHGIMATAPYYNKPPQEGIYNHFRMIAEATSLPVMVYNIPGRASVNIAPDTIVRLAEIDNILAVKEASGSMDQASEIRRRTPDDFLIYSGDDSLTLPIMSVGGHGVVSVISHIVGEQMQEMIKAFLAGDIVTATKIHLDIFPVTKTMFMITSPIPIKAALNIMGMEVGSLRPPMTDAPDDVKAAVRKILQDFKKI